MKLVQKCQIGQIESTPMVAIVAFWGAEEVTAEQR
jgi:hypothetical protein